MVQYALSMAGATLDLFSFDLPADQDLAAFEIEYSITYDDDANNYCVTTGVERLAFWNSTRAGGIRGGASGAFTNVASAVVTIGAVAWTSVTAGTVVTVRVADTLVGVLGGNPAQTITASIRSLSTGTAEV